MAEYLKAGDIEACFSPRDWQYIVYQDLRSTLESEIRLFPCIFGINGFKKGQLRFLFLETIDAHGLAGPLRDFVQHSRSFGANTSLVVLSRPRPVASLASYKDQFWDVLNELHELDPSPWPENVPEQLDTPLWEFSFAGEPIFVVCNTPAHILRQSRRSMSFMMTFQPRWVFDNILGTEAAAAKAFAKVRERLDAYDLIPPSPALGQYGNPENREFAQYFLEDNNEETKCPFHQLARSKEKAA